MICCQSVNDLLKAKAYNTCIAPQAAYRSCRGAVPVTDRAGVQPIGRRQSMRPQTLTCDQTAVRHHGLLINGLHPVIHGLLLIYRPEGMEG